MKYDDDLYSKSFSITGIVEEHLKLDGKEWIKLRFPDNATIVINLRHCKEVNMKRSFLHSLAGKSIDEASIMIKNAGLKLELIPEGCIATTMQARHKTVIVFQENGFVSEAMAGDGLELEKEMRK